MLFPSREDFEITLTSHFTLEQKKLPILHVVRSLNTAKDVFLISHFRNDAKDHFIPPGLEIMGSLCMCSDWKRL